MSRADKAYAGTEVLVSKTTEDIRKLLVRYGAKGMQLTEVFSPPSLNLRFQVAIEYEAVTALATVSMLIPTGEAEAKTERQADQYRRQAARALFFYLKTQLEAVDFGLVKLEEAFLAHFEIPDANGYTTTVGRFILPHFVKESARAVPQLLPGERP